MRDNEKYCVFHAHEHHLEQYSILNTKCIGLIDPEQPEEIKHLDEIGVTFYGRLLP